MAGNLDYGLIAQALGALAVGKGAKGLLNARRVNNYADRLGVDYEVGRFYGGNPDDAVGAINELYKTQKQAKKDQAELEDINAHLGQGVTPFKSVDAAKAFYTGASVPEAKAGMERTRKVQEADDLRDLIQTQPGLFFPGAGGVQNSEGYADGIMDDGSGSPMIQTGAGKYGGLPDMTNMTMDDIYKVIETNRNTSGENRALNQDARNQAEEDRKVELHPYEIAKKRLEADRLRQEIARLKQMLQLNPKLFEARIAALKKGGAGGKLDKLGYLIQKGVDDDRIVEWIMNGEDTSTTTVTYDRNGSPTQTRVSSKGKGGGSTRVPGKPRNVHGIKW